MRTQPRSLLALACAASASLLIAGSTAHAGFTVTLQEAGPNVVVAGAGAIDLNNLTLASTGTENGGGATLFPQGGVEQIFGTPGPFTYSSDIYTYANGPTNFGPGPNASFVAGDFASGDLVGIEVANHVTGLAQIEVPHGYVSGAPLSDSATWNGESFSSLGVTPGVYEWTWGPGQNQNFTIDIGGMSIGAVPEPSTWAAGFLAAAALACSLWRQRAKRFVLRQSSIEVSVTQSS